MSLDVLDEVEHRTIGEEAAPLRIEADKFEVIVEVPAGLREDAAKHARHGEDCRPHVEAEPGFIQFGGFAAEPRAFLEHDDLVTARCECAGCRQPTEPAADHTDAIPFVRSTSQPFRVVGFRPS